MLAETCLQADEGALKARWHMTIVPSACSTFSCMALLFYWVHVPNTHSLFSWACTLSVDSMYNSESLELSETRSWRLTIARQKKRRKRRHSSRTLHSPSCYVTFMFSKSSLLPPMGTAAISYFSPRTTGFGGLVSEFIPPLICALTSGCAHVYTRSWSLTQNDPYSWPSINSETGLGIKIPWYFLTIASHQLMHRLFYDHPESCWVVKVTSLRRFPVDPTQQFHWWRINVPPTERKRARSRD